MANYATLKAAIQAVIKQNGNNEITGAILQASLLSMVNSLGADYQFAGIALPATDPGTPDQNVMYIASVGTYPNFGGTTVASGELGIFFYNGSWSYQLFDIATPKIDGKVEVTKTLNVTSSQQLILLKEFNYGNAICARIADRNAVGTINIAVRSNGASTYHVLTDQWTIIQKPANIDRLYIYSTNVTTAGSVTVQVFYKEFGELFVKSLSGYKFMGYATPTTNPGTPVDPVIYVGGPGTYTYFGVIIPDQYIGFITYDNDTWSVFTIKTTPIAIQTISGDIVQIKDGNTPLYPRTKAEAVYFNGDVEKTLDNVISHINTELDGKIIINNWYQGNFNVTTGKFRSTQTRVSNATPINVGGDVKIICGGDVALVSLAVAYRNGANPITGGTPDTDFITISIPSAYNRERIIEFNPNFPNLYLSFLRYSDSSANLPISEVASNVQIIALNSIERRLAVVEGELNEKVSIPIANSNKLITSGGVEATLHYQNVQKDLAVSSSQQQVLLREFDYGQKVAVRIISNTATLGTDATVECGMRKSDGTSIYRQLSGNWTIFEITDLVFNRIFIYSRGSITAAGTINCEIIFKDVFDAIIKDNEPVQGSTHSIVSGAVYNLANTLDIIDKQLNGDNIQMTFEQGNYINGMPANTNIRIRTGRMILSSEIPVTVKVPASADVRLYWFGLYNLANDYTSFDYGQILSAENYKEFEITEEIMDGHSGLTLILCNATSTDNSITPADASGITFESLPGFIDTTNERLDDLEEKEETGNTVYYGRRQSLKITEETHKCNSVNLVSFRHSVYPYTTKNQSMAVWNNKCFCFNDTNFAETDGFCVVIDAQTGAIIDRVMDIPYDVSPTGRGVSHLNNACFTDQYYIEGDTYPLLLLSRGDYAKTYTKIGQEMYIYRITENNNVFTFTHVKTIIAQHNFLATFNPSWDYDANRKMIWGHCHTQDWRWLDRMNQNYRKFAGLNALFQAYGASYVCVESGAAALVAATITITVGTTTKTINVSPGEYVSEVFPYVENAGGNCLINCAQSADAFPGLYYVYSCDQNGNNKTLIQFRCAIVGFACPDLTDETTVTIDNSQFTMPVYIDTGIFQGGYCCNGKLYLPFQDFITINNEPTDYTGRVIIIVDPESGYIESMIVSASQAEQEGCAIYDGVLYETHHRGGATDETTAPAFEIFKYTF